MIAAHTSSGTARYAPTSILSSHRSPIARAAGIQGLEGDRAARQGARAWRPSHRLSFAWRRSGSRNHSMGRGPFTTDLHQLLKATNMLLRGSEGSKLQHISDKRSMVRNAHAAFRNHGFHRYSDAPARMECGSLRRPNRRALAEVMGSSRYLEATREVLQNTAGYGCLNESYVIWRNRTAR